MRTAHGGRARARPPLIKRARAEAAGSDPMAWMRALSFDSVAEGALAALQAQPVLAIEG